MITNAFSVDVEEYYHAAIFRRGTTGSGRSGFESRVERSVDRLLAILDERRVRGTFFVLGEIAARHPAMVRRIAGLGHEIGCHGDRHEDVSALGPRGFRADVRRAKARLEDVVSAPVIGYRAPNFSIGRTERSWACRILWEEGFRYDSSLFPIVHDRYGIPDAPRVPHMVWGNGADGLVEFPIGTARVLGVNLPIGGGGYFRLFPLACFRWAIRHVNVRDGQPIMFYVHPWELDPGQPRPEMAWPLRFRHYVGIKTTASKLSSLLAEFRFGTIRDALHSPERSLSSQPIARA